MLIAFLYKHYGISDFISLGFCNVILGIFFYLRSFEIRKKRMKTLFTFALVYFFVRFANLCLWLVELSGVTKN